MLEILKSAGLGGDGVLLRFRPRCADLRPLLSKLAFLSGSLFSANRESRLGRLDAMDGLRVRSLRDMLRGRWFSDMSFLGIVSARLGSVSSWMSDSGRVLAQEVTLLDSPLGSGALPTKPPRGPSRDGLTAFPA